ncbi:uncharacterized protein [Montipora capricornis]|uniref:uncharacterized protein isoform X1 n=1 Tax=Montipora capricornis TaxID=246305 RepID=UPI0035F18DBD
MKYSPKRVGRYKKLSLMSFRNVTVVYSACFLVTLYFQRSLSSEEDHKHCRKVLLQRGQNKAGFHRDLLTYVEWDINNIASNSEHKSCHLLLLEHLPNGIYVDPDQIRSGEEFGGPQGQRSQLENQTGDSTKLDNGRGKKMQLKAKGRTRDNGNQERSKTRQAIPKQRSETVPVYEHLTDLPVIETTLCSKGDKKYHDKACISRTCESCGINSLQLLEEEIDTIPNAPKVKWEQFEYVNIQQADGQEKRTLEGTSEQLSVASIPCKLAALAARTPI